MRNLILLFLCLLLLLTAQATAARGERYDSQTAVHDDMIWTSWEAGHHALVDDGTALWIGTSSGLVRFDKESGSHLRLSTADGLPHRKVYAGAVDGFANRWFGGDGGLSRLDAAGEWTHFVSENSGLSSDRISAIAVTAAGDIWTGHAGQLEISHLRPDGTWMTYPNRETAVSLAYENIKETINQNDLWTAAGDEVWVGANAFDGLQWRDRQPPESYGDPKIVTADSQDHVWILEAGGHGVFEWDGQAWAHYEYSPDYDGSVTALVVDQTDVVWAAAEEWYPYGGTAAVYGRLPDEAGPFRLDRTIALPPPVSVLISSSQGLTMAGTNWLREPDGRNHLFEDVPFLQQLRAAVLDGHGDLWLHTYGDLEGALQILDDNGTGTMRDDSGEVVADPQTVTAVELATNGDLWLAWEQWLRIPFAYGPVRYYEETPLNFESSKPLRGAFIYDIFTEDTRRTWFVYAPSGFVDDPQSSGIWRLDDGGTPADFVDDVWTTYKIDQQGDDGIVAARDGKLWYGDSSGVYLHHQDGWQQLSEEPANGLIPARDGVLIVNQNGGVLVIEADGRQYWRSLPDVVLNNYSLVRSTTRRNQLWRVMPGGDVWYWHFDGLLGRWDGQNLQTYESPVYGGFIEVDQNDHVWLTGQANSWSDNTLWRISPRPDFQLATGPAMWLIKAQESRDFALSVVPLEGYANPVQLSISGLPASVTAELQPDKIKPGETAVLSLTTSATSLGQTTIKISGVSGDLSHDQNVTLAVVEQVHEIWLPAVAQQAAIKN